MHHFLEHINKPHIIIRLYVDIWLSASKHRFGVPVITAPIRVVILTSTNNPFVRSSNKKKNTIYQMENDHEQLPAFIAWFY